MPWPTHRCLGRPQHRALQRYVLQTWAFLAFVLVCRAEAPHGVSEPARSVKPGINRPYFEPDAVAKWTVVLEREQREVARKKREIVLRLGLRGDEAVGDIGAGTGLFTALLSRALPHGRVLAVDIVPAFVAQLRARNARRHNVRVVLGKDVETTLPDGSLDLAFLCDVYHHLEFPAAYLSSLHRTLRQDGKLVIVDLERIPGKTPPALLEHVRADKQTVIAEVTAAGFQLEREENFLQDNYFLWFARQQRP